MTVRLPTRQLAMAACWLVFAATVSGCATQSHLVGQSSNTQVAAQGAFAVPPPGGPSVLTVVERRYANAIQQDILLQSPTTVSGQNFLRVQLFGPVGRDGGTTALADPHLSTASIWREMRASLPTVRMQVSPFYAQNSYGPYGYAVGRATAGDICLYAWQRLREPKAGGGPIGYTGTVQVRLRVCDRDATEQDLLRLVNGYTITGGFGSPGWNPYGAPAPADPRLGQTGQPIAPVGPRRVEAVAAPAAPRIAAAPVRRSARISRDPRPASVAPAPLPLPPPGAPTVPPPPGGSATPAATIVPPPAPSPVAPSTAVGAGAVPVVPPPP